MAIIYGIQLYTLRGYLKKPDQVRGVFEKCRALGADTVQVSGMCDMDAKELDGIAKDNNLTICGTHSPYERVVGDTDRLAEEHLTYGCRNIGIGSMPGEFRGGKDKLDKFIGIYNETALKLEKYGITLAYHNHAFEFSDITDGVTMFDYLIENFDKRVQFIPDTYWIKFAKRDVFEYLKKLKGRANLIHLKDYKKKLFLPLMCEIGYGKIDFKEVVRIAGEIGTKWAVVEQDISKDAYKSLEMSMNYIRNNLK